LELAETLLLAAGNKCTYRHQQASSAFATRNTTAVLA